MGHLQGSLYRIPRPGNHFIPLVRSRGAVHPGEVASAFRSRAVLVGTNVEIRAYLTVQLPERA